MKVRDMFYKRACSSEASFFLAIKSVKENERERIVDALIERGFLKGRKFIDDDDAKEHNELLGVVTYTIETPNHENN